ncbi:Holliday junction resolvase RuvX [bacterium]|nr:Holliday junction resolvase RuvX [bacterium]
MANILGIDYGDKNIGLALAQSDSIAVPYKVIVNNGLESLLEALKSLISSENIDIIVVGLPHSFSGQTNERLEITQKFVDYLSDNLEIEVKTVDEQLTSKIYEKMGVNKDLDKHSATAILDTFLGQKNA